MTSETLAIIYGLASAAVWGTGDFAGGMASRRTTATRVVTVAHTIGFVLFVALAILFREAIPGGRELFFGALAGLMGMGGLLALYRGLAENGMGITAPLAAVVTAVIPIFVGIVNEGLPTSIQIIGFCIGLGAVWFLASGGGESGFRWRELLLPVVAGIGFAGFLVFIDQVSAGAVFWPLTAARAASVAALLLVLRFWRTPASDQTKSLGMQAWLLMAMAGLFDAGGNAFVTLATQTGRLDIASILSSMYPASTVLLAWLILGERLTVSQRWGAVLALVAVVLIAL